ncbi:MAG: hypothetical protein WD025_04565, partial [Bacteriovoracaceae bacterium]
MEKKCLNFRHPLKSLHLLLAFGLAFSFTAQAQLSSKGKISRAPANFVPDDDKILVPMVIERNIVDEFHEKHKNDFKDAKQKLRHWVAQEEYAEAYGFEGSGVVNLPSPEQKQKFFERNYLRFITKDVERSANKLGQETAENLYERWSADDELAAIEAQEQQEEFLIKAKRESGQKSNDIKKEVKVGKDKIRFDIQPRLEIGMVKMRFKSPYLNARAWVGINGNQELQMERYFSSTKTNTQVNYFIEQKRVLASLDQRLA